MTQGLKDYFANGFQQKFLMKLPDDECGNIPLASCLMLKRQELIDIEKSLTEHKEEFQLRMDGLRHRHDELEQREYQLKESVFNFNEFLKENDSKQIRAIKKAALEVESKAKKQKEIHRLKEEMTRQLSERERLPKVITKHAIYQEYLDKVLEKAEAFHEISEIIARHKTLTAIHEEMLEQEQANQDRLEQYKMELLVYRKGKILDNLANTNQLTELQKQLHKAQSEAIQWESTWNCINHTSAQKTTLLGNLRMATHNLYQLVYSHQQQGEEAHIKDTGAQLHKIGQYIKDFTAITNDIRLQERRNTQKSQR